MKKNNAWTIIVLVMVMVALPIAVVLVGRSAEVRNRAAEPIMPESGYCKCTNRTTPPIPMFPEQVCVNPKTLEFYHPCTGCAQCIGDENAAFCNSGQPKDINWQAFLCPAMGGSITWGEYCDNPEQYDAHCDTSAVNKCQCCRLVTVYMNTNYYCSMDTEWVWSEPDVTVSPTEIPTQIPTQIPTLIPTDTPIMTPTLIPTNIPTVKPTNTPTEIPTPTITPTPPVCECATSDYCYDAIAEFGGKQWNPCVACESMCLEKAKGESLAPESLAKKYFCSYLGIELTLGEYCQNPVNFEKCGFDIDPCQCCNLTGITGYFGNVGECTSAVCKYIPDITTTPTLTPTPISGCTVTCEREETDYKGMDKWGGDYNCDGSLTGGDFMIWRIEFLDKITGDFLKSDGNCDNKVSLADYSKWREEYLK